jgi:heme/copper-type cytochrome/quinol oxidase subunit 4
LPDASVQILQVTGVVRAPLDAILIYAASLCIVVPFVLEMLALHHLTTGDRRFWTHAAVIFTTIYAVFVTANYVVQLASVIPAQMSGVAAPIRLLEQTPHSMFWDYDAIGYIAMGFATLFAARAMAGDSLDRWVRRSLYANAIVTPLIAVVYFHPRFSTGLLFLGFPWAITAPFSMLMLAISIRRRQPERQAERSQVSRVAGLRSAGVADEEGVYEDDGRRRVRRPSPL